MIRIRLDDVTGRVLGWDNVTEYVQTYSTDLLVEETQAEGLAIGRYYRDGNLTDGEGEDFYSRKRKLSKQAHEMQAALAYNDSRILDAVLDGSIGDLKTDTEQRQKELEEINRQLEALEAEHRVQLESLYRARNKAVDDSIDVRYYSAAVLLIKDENQYLEEWVRWHLGLGFDQLYIYDNGSAVPVLEKVQESLADVSGQITVLDFSGRHKNLQTEAYMHFMEHAGRNVRWAAVLDSDEFLRLPGGGCLNDYLRQHEDYTAINFPFVEYNANGQEFYVDAPVRARFTKEAECSGNMTNKNLVQINRIDGFRTHFPVFDPKKHQVLHPDKETLVMDHYYTKSFQEWCQKMQRGSCDPNWLRRFDEFFRYNPDMEYLKGQTGADQKYGGDIDV